MCRNYENNSIMAHGLHSMIKSEIGCGSVGKPRIEQHQQRPGGGGSSSNQSNNSSGGAAGKMGSRRIFTPQFKLQVLDSYRNDSDCKGNQRATARKYGIHRRQIQKWLQVENNLRSAAANSSSSGAGAAMKINLMGNHQPQTAPQPQFPLHPHHLHPHHRHIHHQNLNSIELKVPLDSARHRVAQNASNNNNNNILGNGKESSACIISPVPTHTLVAPFSHPHHESSSSSASLSVLKPHSRGGESEAAVAMAVSQVQRPSYSPVSGDFPVAPTPTHPFDRLNLLDPYYHPYHLPYAKYAIDCPIDLSLPQHHYRSKLDQALSPCSTISSVYSSRPRSTTPAPVEIKTEADPSHDHPASEDCEAVDLSCRKRKTSSPSDDDASPPKSIKLFKPYLLDEKDDDKDSTIGSPDPTGRPDYPIIWNFHAQQRYYDGLIELNGGYPPSPPYLHQPLTPIPRTPFSSTTLSPSPPSSTTHWAQPQASPVSGYDSSTSISSVYSNDGDATASDGYSYNLELRQQAIDSFYHDAACRGDFRAVASKYNINRKYVEKWLATEEDHHALPASGLPPPHQQQPQIVVG